MDPGGGRPTLHMIGYTFTNGPGGKGLTVHIIHKRNGEYTFTNGPRSTIVFLGERIFLLQEKRFEHWPFCDKKHLCVCMCVCLFGPILYISYTYTYTLEVWEERERDRESFISTAGTSSSGVGA